MFVKLMPDEEKKHAFHASGKNKLGIEEEATTTTSAIQGSKKRRIARFSAVFAELWL
jgi:ABC-type phosphate/phosphonate transport system ATPase subunit